MSSLYDELMKEGKKLAAEGKLYESLSKFEHARKIHETPKVLQRIQKLKDFIQQKFTKSRLTISESRTEESFANQTSYLQEHHLKPNISNNAKQRENSDILHEIQNVKSRLNSPAKIPTLVKDLSPELQTQFNKLKKEAMSFSYEGKFEDALKTFHKALMLCDCSIVKKYIKDIQAMLAKNSKELQEFRNLTDTGKKLAKEGMQSESLGKLRSAFEICPSPKVSRIISTLEDQDNAISKKLFGRNDEMTDFIPQRTMNRISVRIPNKDSENSSQASPSDLNNLSPESVQRFKNLYKKARVDASEGKLQSSLDALKEASSICKTEKVINRIKDLQEHIKKSETDSNEDDQMIALADGFYLFHEIYEKLYPYQRVGVAWMWNLFQKRKGGVLGDDMGLGKTFQVIAFLSGLIDADLVKHVLIIMPVSLLTNWENEFRKWCPGIKVCLFHGSSKKERERCAIKVQKRGHVLLTSYGMVVNNLNNLDHCEGDRFIWDYVILDEGHKIKNPTKTTKAVHEIPAKNRLVLTGTPIQNNLRELWALYDFVHQGALLGSMKTFKMQYETIITRAREKDATVGEKRLGTEMAENLKKLIQPYFLRRTKEEIWGDDNKKTDIMDIACKMADLKLSEGSKVTTRKNDLIIWLPMSEQQCEIYRNFLHSDAVKTILVSKRSPLVELTTLKKICDHPRLLSQRACIQLGLNGDLDTSDMLKEIEDESTLASSIENVSDETLIEESGKMKFLISLLENLKENGHRTLVFSLSRKILDMIHRILTNRDWKVVRIDGTINKTEERERRIQLFQKNPSYLVFLLTTQVGGVGITLTAADRVVIYDPSWNPATDAQAVDRAYRIGQKKDVVVYRLMTCGTVEEKIYRRQIFKDSITRQATGASDPYRYFSKQELRELFVLEDSNYSATQVQLSQMHSGERKTDVSLDEHIAFLHSLNIFGISDHDLMFSKNIKDDAEDNDESAISHDYIKKQVAAAQERIQAEAAVVEDGLRLAGSYVRPYTESIPQFKKEWKKDFYQPPSLPEVIDLSENSPKIQKYQSVNYSAEDIENDDVFTLKKDSEISSLKQNDNEKFCRVMSAKKTPTLKYKPLTFEKNKITDYYYNPDRQSIPSKENDSSTAAIEDTSSEEVINNLNDQQFSCNSNENQPSEFSSELNNSVILLETESNLNHSNEVLLNKQRSYSTNCNIEFDESVLVSSPVCVQSEVSSIQKDSDEIEPNHIKGSLNESPLKSHSILCDSIHTFSPAQKIQTSKEQYETNLHFPNEVDMEGDDQNTSVEELTNLSGLIANQRKSITPLKSPVENVADETMSPAIKSPITNLHQKSEVLIESFHSDASKLDSVNSYIVMENNSFEDKDSEILCHGQSTENKNEHSSLHEVQDEFLTSVVKRELGSGDTRNKKFVPEVNTNSSEKDHFGDYSDTEDIHFSESDGRMSQLNNEMKSRNGSYAICESPTKINTEEYCRTSSPVSKGIPELQSELSMFLNENLCFNNPTPVKSNRKSCARKFSLVSESDSSAPTSHTSSANTSHERIVTESEEDSVETENSIASISLSESVSFVPSSIPSTPLIERPLQRSHSIASPQRITPLRLHKNFISPDSPFAKALATSPLIHVHNNEATLVEPCLSDFESPIQVRKKNFKYAIVSESEESQDEALVPSDQESFRSHRKKRAEVVSSDEETSENESCFKTPRSRPESITNFSNLSSSSESSD